MTSRRTTVAILSPSHAMGRGLAALLAEHEDRVDVVELRACGASGPDVVLYDAAALASGDATAGADLDLVLATTTSTVLAMTYQLRPQLAEQVIERGAHGTFDVATSGTDLADRVVESTDTPVPAAPLRLGHEVGLTPREVDVLSMITAGLSNQEIAERCYLSINSVKTYIRSAYRRIGVTSRAQAVVWCVQHGFADSVAA